MPLALLFAGAIPGARWVTTASMRRCVDASGLGPLAKDADVLVSEVMDQGFALDSVCAFERLADERNAAIFRDIRT